MLFSVLNNALGRRLSIPMRVPHVRMCETSKNVIKNESSCFGSGVAGYLFPGPKDWMTAGCLKELRTLGFVSELKDVASTVQISKARVVRFEGGGGLRIRERARTLAALSCDNLDATLARVVWWDQWRKRCFILQLSRAAI